MGENTNPEIVVQQFMKRVRTELERRRPKETTQADSSTKSASANSVDQIEESLLPTQIPAGKDLAVPQAIHLQFHDPASYSLETTFQPNHGRRYKRKDLLKYHDREFIHAAYWAVLQRPPDECGTRTYLTLLRSGTDKSDILHILANSPEGRIARSQSFSLKAQYFIGATTRLPLLRNFVNMIGAIWNLPEIHRSQRAAYGGVYNFLEQNQTNSKISLETINSALNDLERAQRELTAYAANKPDWNHLSQLGESIDFVNSSLNKLRHIVADKADEVETNRSLEEIRSSLRDEKMGRASLGSQLTNFFEETRQSFEFSNNATNALRLLTNSKADTDQTTRALEFVRLALQKETSDRMTLVERLELVHDETIRALDRIGTAKADKVSLDEVRFFLARSMEAKADRQELTGIANYFLGLLEHRATKLDIATIERAQEGLFEQIKADRADLEMKQTSTDSALAAVRSDATASLEAVFKGVSQALTELEQSKSDRADLERVHASLRSALDTVQSDTNTSLEGALRNVNQTVIDLLKAKADRADFEQMRTSSESALESMRSDASANLEAAFKTITQAVSDLAAQSKADRSNVEQMHDSARSALASVRSDARTSLEGALKSITQSLTDLAQSKADRVDLEHMQASTLSALETARSDGNSTLEAAFNTVTQGVIDLAKSKADRADLEKMLEDTTTKLDVAQKQTDKALENNLLPLSARTDDIRRNVVDQERRLTILLDEVRKRLPEPLDADQIKVMLTEDDHLLDAMYASFEDIFRGTRADIKQRQSIYLPYIKEAGDGESGWPIIDLGCGRGEWLELLRDFGFNGQGVDVNRIFLDRCREMQLNVIEGDAVNFLRDRKPNSIGVITSFHLIEHIPNKALIALLDAALNCLRPGGIAILETPNPRNVQVGSCNFYMDPSHIHPLPPDLMRYLMEARGFVGVEIKELHPFGNDNLITDGNPAINEVINRFFFSAQDYAVIGRKP